MNFFKKHWLGIIFFVAAWMTCWGFCYCIRPNALLLQLIMPTLVISCLLLMSRIIQLDYTQWPWEFKLNDWRKLFHDLKSPIRNNVERRVTNG